MISEKEKQRLKVANNLDHLRQDYCRANLILWALGHKNFDEVFAEGGKIDKKCSSTYFYCGKCEIRRDKHNEIKEFTTREF